MSEILLDTGDSVDYFHKNSERNINVIIQLVKSRYLMPWFSYLIHSLDLLPSLGSGSENGESGKKKSDWN